MEIEKKIKDSLDFWQFWSGHFDVGVISFHSSESTWRLANHKEVGADVMKRFEAWRRQKITSGIITFRGA